MTKQPTSVPAATLPDTNEWKRNEQRIAQAKGLIPAATLPSSKDIAKLLDKHGCKVPPPKFWIDLERLFAAPAQSFDRTEERKVLDWVESWVSNPVGSYSVYALDGLFGMTRHKIAALRSTVTSTERCCKNCKDEIDDGDPNFCGMCREMGCSVTQHDGASHD